jgi:Flp pilus assembly pilin Flp
VCGRQSKRPPAGTQGASSHSFHDLVTGRAAQGSAISGRFRRFSGLTDRRVSLNFCPQAGAVSFISEKDQATMMPLKRFMSDEHGLETVEYAIIAGLIVSGLVAIIVAIGGWVKNQFSNLQKDLPGA